MAAKNETTPPTRSQALSARAGKVYAKAADKVGDAASVVEKSPTAALVGGLALGALAGAVLPRSAKEKELLAATGERINAAARAAIDAGREAGTEALTASGFGTDALKAQASRLVSEAGKAASAAGLAALDAARATDKAR